MADNRRDQKIVSILTLWAEKTPLEFSLGFVSMVDVLAFHGSINLGDRKRILEILDRGIERSDGRRRP